jgi:hypothetical protein
LMVLVVVALIFVYSDHLSPAAVPFSGPTVVVVVAGVEATSREAVMPPPPL